MFEVILICWTLVSLLSQVGRGVNHSPKGKFFPRRSNITLICTDQNASYVLWTEKETTDTIFVNNDKISKNEKYSNFHVNSQNRDDFSLEISHADVSDDGTYVCQGSSNNTETTIVIEAPPTLSINISGDKSFDHTSLTSSGHSIRISCLAKGAKPAVKLKIKINDGDWIQPVDHNITKYGDLYESYVKSGVVLLTTESSITCQASGQESIADVNYTEIIYPPICSISQETNTVTCYCTANPPVFRSTLLVNGLEKYTNTLEFRKYIPADFTCSGANYIGKGSSTVFIGATSGQRRSIKLLYGLIVTACVVSVLSVAIACYFQRNKGYSGVQTEEHEMTEIYELLPKLATKVTCDWEIFALDDLKLQKNDVIAIVKSTNDFQGQVQAALECWLINNKEQPPETLKSMLSDTLEKSTVYNQNKFDISTEKSDDATDTPASEDNDIAETNTTSYSEYDVPQSFYRELVQAGSGQKFSRLLNDISKSVGEVGLTNLQKHYSASVQSGNTCKIFFTHLVETKQVQNTFDSLNLLCGALKECRLFYAQNLVLTYIKSGPFLLSKFRLAFVTLNELPKTNEDGESQIKV